MPRKNAATKGRRYLTEGRLTVHTVEDDLIVASCRGDSAVVYRLTWDPGGWDCTCPAVTDKCSHLRALRLVTLVNRHVRWILPTPPKGIETSGPESAGALRARAYLHGPEGFGL